ncbi:hypothetical protein ACFWHF_14445 [Streptomyces griseoincarnatus]
MAKQTGLGDNLYVGGYNVSGDINAIGSVHGGNSPIDVTDITQSAISRIGGKRDGGITFTALFNPDTGRAHPVLSALPTADTQVMYCRGTTVGGPGAALVAKQLNYDGTRADDGSFTFAVEAQANGYGLEWGVQLTAGLRTDTAATNGTGVDLTDTSTTFGWQAYLQVFSVTGTSVTVKIQDSADNSTFADLSGASFTAATGPGWQRTQASSGTATVRRYVRVVTSGTFSNAQFAVLFVRNASEVTF